MLSRESLAFFLVIVTVASGGLLQKPSNVAVVQGNSASFTCQVEQSDGHLQWSKMGKDASTVSIAQDGTINGVLQGYSLDYDANSRTSTLTISAPTTSDAGTFICQILFGNASYAQLIVLESDPVCANSVLVDPILEGTDLTVTCEVTAYAGIDWYPTMAWSLSDGSSLTATENVNGDVVQSSYTEAITQSREGLNFQVTATFPSLDSSIYPSTWDHAMNVPSYSFTYTGPTIQVHYPVSAITFEEENTVYAVNDSIRCISDGVPTTSKAWINNDNQDRIDDEYLPITSSMLGQNNWTCEASHTVFGTSYSVMRSIAFDVELFVNSGPTLQSEVLTFSGLLLCTIWFMKP